MYVTWCTDRYTATLYEVHFKNEQEWQWLGLHFGMHSLFFNWKRPLLTGDLSEALKVGREPSKNFLS